MKTKSKSNKKVSIKKLVLSFVFAAMFLLTLASVCSSLIPSHSASTLVCERINGDDDIRIKCIRIS